MKRSTRAEKIWKKKGYAEISGGAWPYMPTIDDINEQLMRLYNEIDKRIYTYIRAGCTTIKGKQLTDLLSILKEIYFNKKETKPRAIATKRKTVNNPLQ